MTGTLKICRKCGQLKMQMINILLKFAKKKTCFNALERKIPSQSMFDPLSYEFFWYNMACHGFLADKHFHLMTQSMLVELRQHLRNFKELILKWLLSNIKRSSGSFSPLTRCWGPKLNTEERVGCCTLVSTECTVNTVTSYRSECTPQSTLWQPLYPVILHHAKMPL